MNVWESENIIRKLDEDTKNLLGKAEKTLNYPPNPQTLLKAIEKGTQAEKELFSEEVKLSKTMANFPRSGKYEDFLETARKLLKQNRENRRDLSLAIEDATTLEELLSSLNSQVKEYHYYKIRTRVFRKLQKLKEQLNRTVNTESEKTEDIVIMRKDAIELNNKLKDRNNRLKTLEEWLKEKREVSDPAVSSGDFLAHLNALQVEKNERRAKQGKKPGKSGEIGVIDKD